MAQIVIANLEEKIVPVQDFSKNLLQHFQHHSIDWMHTCGGKGKCTTCSVRVLNGMENIAPKTEAELKYEKMGSLQENERLACQAKINGDIRVEVPKEFKLPHITYSY